MRKFISLAVVALLASSMSAQTIANMKDLNAEKKSAAINLKLTGTLTTTKNSDFRQLRDLCWQLRNLDLSEATCPVLPKNAFHSRHHLQHIILPNQLQEIGTQAFFACDNLQEVVIPKSVTKVGAAAFSGCKSLKTITIEGAPEIGEFSFANLEGVQVIRVNSHIPPKAAATAFSGVNMRGVKLVMPRGSEKAYRKAQGWKAFFGEVKQAREVCNPEACLIPVPMELKVKAKAAPLQVAGNWKIVADEGLANEREHADRILKERNAQQKGAQLTMTLAIDPTLTDAEAYTLEVQQKGVIIKGKTAAGVFYGLMTFDQLLRGNASKLGCDAIPQLALKDQPRTHVRELMVDPCRIFIPYEELKAFVPEMARYKLNMLHLHLVDDQAWTIEIKKYPRLTAEASSRWGMDDMLMPIKGYYTQEQMRDFVAYCAKYHIQVVPEIEMPGHEVAAISVYPELTCQGVRKPIRTTCGVSDELLCAGNEFTYEFLGNVFKELADVFPSEYIHLGGDEAGNPALDCWTNCPKCQALKKKLGITSTDRSEKQPFFSFRISTSNFACKSSRTA
jgi:hexosaminidase